MKITEVRVILTCPGRNYVLVKIVTDEGVYGVGDGTLNGSELAVATAIEHCSHLLIGMDPQRIEDIWYFLYHHTYCRHSAPNWCPSSIFPHWGRGGKGFGDARV